MKRWQGRWQNRWTVFLYDMGSVPLAWFGAYWLRFNLGLIPTPIWKQAVLLCPWVFAFQVSAFWGFGLYRGVWRFASLPDLMRIVKALMVGSLASLGFVFWMTKGNHFPRSVFPLYNMLLLLLLGGARFWYRWIKEQPSSPREAKRVLIVGAGKAGESLIRELLREKGEYCPVALVDDDQRKQGRELHGVRVVGVCDAIASVVARYTIDMVLIALPLANAGKMRQIVSLCESIALPVRTLPAIHELVSGTLSVKSLREVALEDLLGRDPVQLDWEGILDVLAGKTVLLSGGGGSIGAELCRQIIKLHPREIIIVDNNEYHLFCIMQELLEHSKSHKTLIQGYLIDVCDRPALEEVFSRFRPQIVFHAAAYKHVPLLEPQIRAAVKNNVLGTYVLSQVAVAYQVEKMVLVSTDKAVNPTNIMGATKRVAELVCQYFNMIAHKTQFMTVRFGNVLGSRGSVIETFQKQLERGGPLTVTHREVTRYFMTIQEAAQLILQALAMGKGGELFVLDMGDPIKIRYIAEQMIRLAGKTKEEISIEYIGLRAGEKLLEELFHPREKLLPTAHTKILSALPRQIQRDTFEYLFVQMQEALATCDVRNIFDLLCQWVPEWQPLTDKQTQKQPTLVV